MTWGIASLAALAALALLAMVRGWRTRGSRTADLVPAPPEVPADEARGAARGPSVTATYVSTTLAGQPFERVVAHGLGTRSAAHVSVHDQGVLLRRDGAPDLFVPAADLVEVGAAAGMAGKVVGGDGLVVLTWQVHGTGTGTGPVRLDTGLRTRRRADRATLTQALTDLIPTGPTASTPHTADPAPAAAPTTEEHS